MDQHIIALAEKRNRLFNITKDLSTQQFNLIPEGFNNNIIWNVGHLIAFSENLLYVKSGLSMPFHPLDLANFNMGTIPNMLIEKEEIALIRNLYVHSFNLFAAVLLKKQGRKQDLMAELTVDENIIKFLLFHEDQHFYRILEIMQAIKATL